MRHLTTDELLLYAEGELESRGLCSHVRDCVDCKARLVDLQEIYVHATAALRPRCQGIAARPPQMRSLRLRLAAEAELLSAHLGTEELLLAVEDQLGAGEQAHLRACGACQDRAAELHVQLAEIECELHAQRAFELPASRRAAALAALRERLALEVESRTVAARPWIRLPRLGSIRVPAFASYALAGALAGLIAWTGWMALSGTGGVTVAPETPDRRNRAGACRGSDACVRAAFDCRCSVRDACRFAADAVHLDCSDCAESAAADPATVG